MENNKWKKLQKEEVDLIEKMGEGETLELMLKGELTCVWFSKEQMKEIKILLEEKLRRFKYPPKELIRLYDRVCSHDYRMYILFWSNILEKQGNKCYECSKKINNEEWEGWLIEGISRALCVSCYNKFFDSVFNKNKYEKGGLK